MIILELICSSNMVVEFKVSTIRPHTLRLELEAHDRMLIVEVEFGTML